MLDMLSLFGRFIHVVSVHFVSVHCNFAVLFGLCNGYRFAILMPVERCWVAPEDLRVSP